MNRKFIVVTGIIVLSFFLIISGTVLFATTLVDDIDTDYFVIALLFAIFWFLTENDIESVVNTLRLVIILSSISLTGLSIYFYRIHKLRY